MGPPRQQRGRVEHERKLHQLRGLELQRPGSEPAASAVDADPDMRDVHGEHEHEGDEQQRRGDALHLRDAVAREQVHEDQAEAPVDQELDEIAAAVAMALEQSGRRGCAVDHHRPEGEQAQRCRQQQAMLERSLRGCALARAATARRLSLRRGSAGAPSPGCGCWHLQ